MYNVYCIFALLAQWIERSPPERKVAGSNPVQGTYSISVFPISIHGWYKHLGI